MAVRILEARGDLELAHGQEKREAVRSSQISPPAGREGLQHPSSCTSELNCLAEVTMLWKNKAVPKRSIDT